MSSVASSVKRLPASRVQCTVIISEEQQKKAEARAIQELGKNVNLPGFRPGHAPADQVRSKLSTEAIGEQTIRFLLPDILPVLITEEKLSPIVPPNVALTSAKPLTLEITFVEKPSVKVKSSKFNVEKTPMRTDDKDVDRVVENMLREFRTFTVVDRPAKESDRVTMNFWGADAKGEKLPQVTGQGYSVIIGSKQLIPGFEEALVGTTKGAEKSFTLTFPKDYREQTLQGQPVTFNVTVTQVEEVKTPDVTDAFVQEKFQMSSAEALRTDIRKHLEDQEKSAEENRREGLLLEEIRKATVVELADELVASELRGLMDDLLGQLRDHDMSLSDWLKSRSKTEADLEKEMTEQAKARLTLRFGVEALIEEKGLKLSEAEIDEAVSTLLSSVDAKERQQLEPLYAPNGRLRDQLAWQKTVEKLLQELLA